MAIEKIKRILQTSKSFKWPYPKTFKLLKNAGVESYSVNFIRNYDASYSGSFGTWKEQPLAGYKPLEARETFFAKGVHDAIINHATKQTLFLDFLSEIAANGATHYYVSMADNTVTYYNALEDQCHVEPVPEWKKDIF